MRLPDGDVLVAGGTDADGAIATAERYDAATGGWSPAGTLADPRRVPAVTALLDGRILVTGGWDGARALRTVELYDPAAGRWSAVASMRVARESHTATTLPDGRVLGWRGRASLTLAARQRLGSGTYTLVLRPAARPPVRIRVSLP